MVSPRAALAPIRDLRRARPWWPGGFRQKGRHSRYLKRQHEPQRIVGDLLKAEINEKQARSIKYQLTIAKLPLAKDLDDFEFANTPINETLVTDLAGGGFIAQQRNVVLVGGTGTGKTHLTIAIARSCIRGGARGRFYNVVDLVNKLEAETRNGRQGRLADHLSRFDFVVLDELGYLPFAQAGGQLLFHLAAVIAAAVDDDTGQLYAEEMILVGEDDRKAILEAIKEGGAADNEAMPTLQ